MFLRASFNAGVTDLSQAQSKVSGANAMFVAVPHLNPTITGKLIDLRAFGVI
ncbi:MAG: hypothetical protein ACYSR5_09245 [Planctomycetota bacterium]|jgi:hypothetical protein